MGGVLMATIRPTVFDPLPPLNTPEDVALVAADTIRRFPDQPELLAMLGIEVQS